MIISKIAKVIFENPIYNYQTRVNHKLRDADIQFYFEGKYFDVGVYPTENLQKCVKCEVISKRQKKD